MLCLGAGESSPLCLVSKASAGNRCVGDACAPVGLLHSKLRFFCLLLLRKKLISLTDVRGECLAPNIALLRTSHD